MNPPDTSLDPLTTALAEALPALSADQQRTSLWLYRLLAEGQPVTLTRLAQAVDLPELEVGGWLDGWPGVFRDDSGGVIGFWGLSLPEMAHRFEVRGRTLYTWCAWDSLFLPELIGKSADVASASPVSGEPVSLTVAPDRVERLEPAGAVVSFLTPDTSFDGDVIASFCHYVHFFRTAAEADGWTAARDGTFHLAVQEAFAVGKATNQARFGAALGAVRR